jgi:hypothetical protein
MASTVVSGVSLYLLIGAVVALLFASLVGRIDPAARGVYGFRLLLLPGAALLWPVVIVLTLRAVQRSKAGAP